MLSVLWQYEALVVANTKAVSSIEALLHSLVCFTPSRVKDADINQEALYAGINLLSLYHEHIRMRHGIIKAPHGMSVPATVLRATQTIEVLIELTAISRRGQDRKWAIVAVIEVFKAALRMAMLREQGWKMVMEAEAVDPLAAMTAGSLDQPEPSSMDSEPSPNKFAGRRTGRNLRCIRPPTESPIGTPHNSPATVKSATTSPSPAAMEPIEQSVRKLRLGGELLHIMRPVVYLATYLWSDQHSWKPVLLSLAMDLFSLRLLSKSKLSPEEQGEMSRRSSLFFLYLVRSPVYERIFRPVCMVFFNRIFQHIPIIKQIVETFIGVFDGLHSLHFYTAGS